MSLNYFKKLLVLVCTLFILVIGGVSIWLSSCYTVPIMMYHNVDHADVPKANTVSPERFEWHMEYLKKHKFNVLGLDELVKIIQDGQKLPRKSVVITFDDGYIDNYEHAFKVLKKYQFPATIFVSSDLIGASGYLNYKQLNEMLQNDIDIGSHTRHHAYLPDLAIEYQYDEIVESKKILENNLGVAIDAFAYPSGGFSDSVRKMVKDSGYKGACATNRGYDRFNKDVYELNRIRFSDKDDRLDYLWIKLSGYYNLFRKAKKPY